MHNRQAEGLEITQARLDPQSIIYIYGMALPDCSAVLT
jgi:hypothetical protein